MCGIAGWIDLRQDLRTRSGVVRAMTETLAPRGPDAQGIWGSEHAVLGHRRLAVIDISRGSQPMVRSDPAGNRIVLTFSGEIYNFVELRSELSTHGWSFETNSDTEVLLNAYRQWGYEVAEHLNGMFAFAIWDERLQELFLVRDRLGIKPLFWAQVGEGVVFGSEPKALLAHGDLPAEIDREGIAELFAVPRARTPGTAVFRGLHELRPGHTLVVRDGRCHEHRYWALEAGMHDGDFSTSSGQIRELLEDIVRRQLVADVPVGTLLSGGIDSSALTAIAARAHGERLSSWSVRVPSTAPEGSDAWRPDQDEPYARMVAKDLGVEHRVAAISADELIEHVDRGLLARDLPGWGDLDTSMFLLFQTVREHCTVALSGESADEMFGGYTWQLDEGFIGHSSFPWMYGRRQPEVLLREDVRQIVEPKRYEADRYHEALAEVPFIGCENRSRRREREVFQLGITRWLSALLDRKDRMSMAVGLEVRVPFADHRLAEYMFDVPSAVRTAGGTSKALLRHASRDLLPEAVRTRPKSAYPVSRDDALVARLCELLRELLRDRNAPLFELVDRRAVQDALDHGVNDLPGPLTASSPAVSLSYLLSMNRWLELYGVRVVA